MISKVKTTFSKYGFSVENADITVGVSGGADSVALLLALIELKNEFQYTLKVVHINHNLRNEESLRDEIFVRNLCGVLNIPCFIESLDVNRLAKKRNQSIELCARELRYEAFAKYSKGLIATAHNSDDNAETIILNLCRGTGLKGLCGIPPVRDNIIRPLIECSREEILEYLKLKNQSYVTDSSNNSDDYTRNKIRHNVIPVLKSINPAFVETASKVTATLMEDNSYIEDIIKDKFCDFVNGKYVSKKLAECPISIRKRVLLQYCKTIGAESSFDLIREMDRVLTGEIRATLISNYLTFHKTKLGFLAETKEKNPEYCFRNFNLKEDNLPSGKFLLVSSKKSEELKKVNNLFSKFSLDCDKIVGNITVRSRKDGDKYRPVFRNVTKSIRKLMCEEKPEFKQKRNFFVLEDEEGIIFTNLFGIDERVKVTDKSDNILVYQENDNG